MNAICIKNAINIGNKTFLEYLNKRLVKNGLGFVPSKEFMDGSTDRKSYIKAVIPRCHRDFLVYAHELGHAVGKQVKEGSDWHGAFFMPMGTSVAKLENECLAWDYALRYVRRLGMNFMKHELEDVLKKTLGSYINGVSYKNGEEANKLIEHYSVKWDLDIPRATARDPWSFGGNGSSNKGSIKIEWDKFTFDEFDKIPVDVVEPIKKNPKWKPWHDIVEQKNRKFHKQKHKA